MSAEACKSGKPDRFQSNPVAAPRQEVSPERVTPHGPDVEPCSPNVPKGDEGRCPRASEGAALAAPGVISSNTPPPTSKLDSFTGGEDWFEWSVYVDWLQVWGELQKKLECAKSIAASPRLAKESAGDLITFGGSEALVDPSGARRGKKRKGLYVAYRFEVEGLQFQLTQTPVALGNMPNTYVLADGMKCLNRGAKASLDFARNLIERAGGKILKEKLSRVDMCLDLPDVPMDELVSAYRDARYICRADVKALYESSGITIALGKSPLMVRIYDKAAEIRYRRDIVKLALMELRRWHWTIPEHAARVEFQISREALTRRGIDTPDNYFMVRGDLIRYLCTDWVRFTSGQVHRTNTSRTKILPLWEKVLSGFLDWTGQPVGDALRPLDRQAIDRMQLVRQALGVMITEAATGGFVPQL